MLLLGIFPSLRPSFNGVPLNMSSVIEMVMMSVAGLILLVGKADVRITSEWTTENGVIGRRFTGPNGASIFLPAAGYSWRGRLYNEIGRAHV